MVRANISEIPVTPKVYIPVVLRACVRSRSDNIFEKFLNPTNATGDTKLKRRNDSTIRNMTGSTIRRKTKVIPGKERNLPYHASEMYNFVIFFMFGRN